MKTKLVLWGSNATEEKILIAMQLRSEDNKVDIWTFPEAVATDEFARQLLGDWRNNVAVPFPESATHLERELSMTDSLLPEEIKVERGDIIQRAQTEWHFVVLSSKLNEVYQTELGELKTKVAGLKTFNNDAWNELKSFWSKVQNQVRERNLLRGHADSLRDETNALFAQLKSLRSALDEEFRQNSQKLHNSFMEKLASLEQRAQEGTRLPALFDELKDLQRKFREIKLTREHRSKIWERLDATFKVVKEKRFGPNANNESSALDRLNRRYNGLLGAIDKMQKSIARDQDDLTFQQRKIDSSDGQLEAQIRQAKIKMTKERIRSKNEKLAEMLQTKTDLEKRIASQKDKEARRQKQGEIAAAKAAAKAAIASKIAASALARKDEDEKLSKAAEAIGHKKQDKSVETPATEAVANGVAVAGVIEEVTTAETPVAEEVAAAETPAAEAVVEIVTEEVAAVETPAVEAVVETVTEEVAAVEAPAAEAVVETVTEEVATAETPVAEAVVETATEEVSNELDEVVANGAAITEIINKEDTTEG